MVICASPDTVFRFFTGNARWAKWWGAGSTIDAQPGGSVLIRHPNGVEVTGEVIEIQPPQRLVFTYGFASGKPIPPGSSRVTIDLAEASGGTRLKLTHEFAEEAVRDQHVQGWRFQLSVFSNAVSDEVNAGAASLIDQWFALWTLTDAAERERVLERIAAPSVAFRDRYSLLEGISDLSAHIGASQRFMPGIAMERRGPIRHCQGTVLAEWAAVGEDGEQRMSGTNVFVMDEQARIASVTGVADSPAQS